MCWGLRVRDGGWGFGGLGVWGEVGVLVLVERDRAIMVDNIKGEC